MEVKTFIEKKKAYNPVIPEISEVESRNPELVGRRWKNYWI